jgi:hypothetical protein
LKRLTAAGITVCILGLCAPAALAAGGASIAAAPTVACGQQEFGNTVTDSHAPSCDSTIGPGRSWWLLVVTTGDRVTIDLEGQTEGDGFTADVYKPGTNDFNYASQFDPYATNQNSAAAFADKFELSFTAPSSGLMPLDVSTCDSIGSYDFTATVSHRLVLALTDGATDGRRHRTRFALSVRNPDGAPVSDGALRMRVQLLGGHGHWSTLWHGPVNSAFSITWARSKRQMRQSVRVQVFGARYQTATSRAVSLTAR